jgi:PAS domain S-box-containing protein
LAISLAVSGLLWLGTVTDVFRGVPRMLADRLPGHVGQILMAFVLLSAGLALFAVRLWRVGSREATGRAVAETRFRSLVEEMPAVTITWDPRRSPGSRAPRYISPQVASVFGLRADEWRSNPRLWVDRIHPDERLSIEYRHLDRDGAVMWVREESSVVEHEPAGRPTLVQALLFDVTERKRAEEQLVEAEARYRTLVERVPAVTYIWDATFQSGEVPAAYVSPQIEFLLGYSQAEFEDPKLWHRLVHPDDLDRVLAEWAASQEGTMPFRSEYRMRARDGHLVWVRDEAVLVGRDEQGHPLFQGVMFDVTERKLADEKLRAAERRYRALVENMPVVTYLSDYLNDPPQRYIAPRIHQLLGYMQGEWMADPGIWRSLIHPADRERVLAEVGRTDRTGDPFIMEYRLLAKDGSVVWVRDEAVIVEQGPTTDRSVWQGVFVDITRRKEAEQRLREAEERYRTLVENLPAVAYIDDVDERTTPIYVSPQVETLFGYTPGEWFEAENFDVIHHDDRDRVLAAIDRHNRLGEPFDAEYRFLAKDGRWRWISDRAAVVRDELGGILFLAGGDLRHHRAQAGGGGAAGERAS